MVRSILDSELEDIVYDVGVLRVLRYDMPPDLVVAGSDAGDGGDVDHLNVTLDFLTGTSDLSRYSAGCTGVHAREPSSLPPPRLYLLILPVLLPPLSPFQVQLGRVHRPPGPHPVATGGGLHGHQRARHQHQVGLQRLLFPKTSSRSWTWSNGYCGENR